MRDVGRRADPLRDVARRADPRLTDDALHCTSHVAQVHD